MDRAYGDEISGFHAKMRFTIVASFVQELHWRLMSLLWNYHFCSLKCQPCCKCQNKDRKPFNGQVSISDDRNKVQPGSNMSSSWLTVGSQTHPHHQKHSTIWPSIILSPHCRPSATNRLNCLLVAFKSHHHNCHCVEPNKFCIIEITRILNVIDVVWEIGRSVKPPCNVIL